MIKPGVVARAVRAPPSPSRRQRSGRPTTTRPASPAEATSAAGEARRSAGRPRPQAPSAARVRRSQATGSRRDLPGRCSVHDLHRTLECFCKPRAKLNCRPIVLEAGEGDQHEPLHRGDRRRRPQRRTGRHRAAIAIERPRAAPAGINEQDVHVLLPRKPRQVGSRGHRGECGDSRDHTLLAEWGGISQALCPLPVGPPNSRPSRPARARDPGGGRALLPARPVSARADRQGSDQNGPRLNRGIWHHRPAPSGRGSRWIVPEMALTASSSLSLGSIPSSSTSVSRAARYASSASAWRPAR